MNSTYDLSYRKESCFFTRRADTRGNKSIPRGVLILGVRWQWVLLFLNLLTLEDGTDLLYQNIGKELSRYAA